LDEQMKKRTEEQVTIKGEKGKVINAEKTRLNLTDSKVKALVEE
jgi:hypothetical protein